MKDNIVAKGFRFLKYSKHKKLIAVALIYSAYYRFCILFIKPKQLCKKWGIEGEESPGKESKEVYRYCTWVAYAVEHACRRTVWESKCLVRALTAQRMLKKKGISSTLYLGCGMDEGKMIAHAWLRVGEYYVTGGNGNGYAVVDKFMV